MSWLRKPSLWITLASLGFMAVALHQQSGQLMQQSLDGWGWAWLLLGMGLTWASILCNGLAWWVLVAWLGHPPDDVALVPLFVRSNLLKYLPGGVWHLLERVRVLRGSIGVGPALATVILDPLLIVVASLLLLPLGGWQGGLMLLAPLPALLMLPRWRSRCCRDWNVARLSSCAVRPMEIWPSMHRGAGAAITRGRRWPRRWHSCSPGSPVFCAVCRRFNFSSLR